MAESAAASVSEFLQEAELHEYIGAFLEQGWDSLTQLKAITDADLALLIADVKMKSGHAARLRKALGLSQTPTGAGAGVTGRSVRPPPQSASSSMGPTPPPPPQEPSGAPSEFDQKRLLAKLTEKDLAQQCKVGNLLETYKAPDAYKGGEVVIRVLAGGTQYR